MNFTQNYQSQKFAELKIDLCSESVISLIGASVISQSSETSLIITINDLTTLPDNIFNGLNNLLSLRLSGTNLTTIPEKILNSPTQLEWLDLSQNHLTALFEHTFNGLNKLESLDLSFKNLTILCENTLNDLTINQIDMA